MLFDEWDKREGRKQVPTRHVLEVWGDYACFTQPVMKVERFSYPIMTPSAARGILEAIYWKPKFHWQVLQIDMLTEPRYVALMRNEVKEKAPAADTILRWMNGQEEVAPIMADATKADSGSDQKGRTQRQTMALKDVRYRIHAEIRPFPAYRHELTALDAQFARRAARGQCIYQPCLGCREFPAFFRPAVEDLQTAVPLNLHIGWMLYDVFDLGHMQNRTVAGSSRPTLPVDREERLGGVAGRVSISLFNAEVNAGKMLVPEYDSPAVKKTGGGEADA